MTDAPARVRSIRLDLIEEEALHSSNAGVMLQVEPADLLLMIAELRAARAALALPGKLVRENQELLTEMVRRAAEETGDVMPIAPPEFNAQSAPRSEPSALPCKACGGCGLVHYRARGGSITGSGPCACRLENHLKGKR